MNDTWKLVVGVGIPFVGTTLGAAMVFLLKKEMGSRLQKALLGFASGVMIAASVWSLLIPAIEMASSAGVTAWLPALIGFLAGVGFLLSPFGPTANLHNHLTLYSLCFLFDPANDGG